MQVHQDDFMLNVKLQLFALVAKQPAFHQLRSVEQLGYITVLMQRYICVSKLLWSTTFCIMQIKLIPQSLCE